MPELIQEMVDTAWRLMESSKTSTGKQSMTLEAINNRVLAYKIQEWVLELRKIKVVEVIA